MCSPAISRRALVPARPFFIIAPLWEQFAGYERASYGSGLRSPPDFSRHRPTR